MINVFSRDFLICSIILTQCQPGFYILDNGTLKLVLVNMQQVHAMLIISQDEYNTVRIVNFEGFKFSWLLTIHKNKSSMHKL